MEVLSCPYRAPTCPLPMFRRYRKIKGDSRFSAAEDRGRYSVCGDSAAKLLSFISFYLLLTPFIYKASEAYEN